MFEQGCTITGKHAKYFKTLIKNSKKSVVAGTNPDEVRLFGRPVDAYLNAVIFGGTRGFKEEPDESDNSSEDYVLIPPDSFTAERVKCLFIYRLVILFAERDSLTEEKIKEIFLGVVNEEEFHRYALGGIKYLYENFVDNCKEQDKDYATRELCAKEISSKIADLKEKLSKDKPAQDVLNLW